MRLITGPVQLPYPPRACAVTNRHEGDFVDFNTVIDRPEPTRLYLRKEIVEDAGRLCGMVPAAEIEGLEERLKALSAEFSHLKDTLNLSAELDELVAKERTACP